MIRHYISIIFLFLSFTTSNAQMIAYQASAKFETNIVGNYGDFLIDINRSDQFLNIKFHVKDSINEEKLAKDPIYKQLMRLDKKGRLTWNKTNGEAYIAGKKKYTVYSSDSLIIQKDSVTILDKLLNQIANSTDEELVNNNVTYIDGFDIQLFIKSSEMYRELNVHSPSQKYSPLIKELLHHLILLSNTTSKHLLRRTVIKGY